jgi:uncharacterized membrane protein YebE (DUF533 family)
MTILERELRRISDLHLDDTAQEMSAMERANELHNNAVLLVHIVRAALMDGVIEPAEAAEIVESAQAVCDRASSDVRAWHESVQANIAVESGLTRLAQELRGPLAQVPDRAA